MSEQYFAVFITVPSLEEGKKIARVLVEEKLAACVNLFPQVESLYWWEGKIENTQEAFLLAKTIGEKVEALERAVMVSHSYSVPEIIALPIIRGSDSYLSWLRGSIS